MGAIAEAIVAYAQPLLNQTDGSPEQLSKAFSISNFCYTIAQLPVEHRQEILSGLKSSEGMDDAEFKDFQASIILPMIERYETMFKNTAHNAHSLVPSAAMSRRTNTFAIQPTAKKPEPAPYSLCPCNSGRKYKFCCKEPKVSRLR